MHPLSQTNFRQAKREKKKKETTTIALNRFSFSPTFSPFALFGRQRFWKAGFAFAGVSLKLIHASRPPGALRCFNEAAWEAGRVTGLVFRARFVFRGNAKLRGFAARSVGCV